MRKFLTSIITALVATSSLLFGAVPAHAAAPALDGFDFYQGVPQVISIKAGYVTKRDTVYSSAQTSVSAFFVCDVAVTSPVSTTVNYIDGNADWFIMGTQNPNGAGATIGTADHCFAIDSLGGPSSDELDQATVGYSTTVAYDPDTHGRHLVYGSRVYVAADGVYYWELSRSVEYKDPATPKVLTVADCSLNTTTMPSGTTLTGAVGDQFILRNSGSGTCQVYDNSKIQTEEGLNQALGMNGSYYSLGSGFGNVYKVTATGSFTIVTNNGAGDTFTINISAPVVTPTVLTQPQLVVGQDGSLTKTSGTWSGGPLIHRVMACASSVTASTVPGNSLPSGCTVLWSNSTNPPTQDASSLTAAHVYSGGSFTAYDPATHGANVLMTSTLNTFHVWTATTLYNSSSSVAAVPPYTGPVVNPPSLAGPVARGGKVTLGGSNLSGVTKVEINGLDCAVSVNSRGELEITVPAGLAAGTYDLVVTSSSGKLTVQDGIRVSADSLAPLAGQDVRPSAKKNELAGEVKVRIFDVIGAGKVQIFVNGKEIAWINAVDSSDSKLFEGYLVRTVSLVEGKTAIEVYVDGVRVQRWAYWR